MSHSNDRLQQNQPLKGLVLDGDGGDGEEGGDNSKLLTPHS